MLTVARQFAGSGLAAALPLLLLLLLVPLTVLYDAPVVLGAGVLLAVAAVTVAKPELATLAVVFILYTNLVVVATQREALPEWAAAGVALLLGAPLAHFLLLRRDPLKADGALALMLGFLGVLVLSSLAARDLSIAALQVATFVLEGLLLYFLILNVVRTLPSLKRVIWAALLAGGLLGALSLYQALTRSYGQEFGGLAQRNLQYEIENAGSGSARRTGASVRLADRAHGPVGDPNRYAQILLVLLPLSAFQFWSVRTPWARAGAAAVGGLILSGILLSYSRGALVALALLFLLLLFLRCLRPTHILLSLAAVVVAVTLVAPGFYDRMESIGGAAGLFSGDAPMEPDAVTRGRATEMLAAGAVFLDHPILGVGPGQYTPFYSVPYQLKPEIKFRQIPRPRRAHNLFFEIAAETGLIGLVVFLSIPLVALYRLWECRSRFRYSRPELANLATALLFSIVAYLATGMFLHLSHERYYWFLLALAGAAQQVFAWEKRAAAGSDKPGAARDLGPPYPRTRSASG